MELENKLAARVMMGGGGAGGWNMLRMVEVKIKVIHFEV